MLILTAGFFMYVSLYYHADETAEKSLISDSVTVSETEYGWLFDGPGSESCYIFYPGAKVEETAYAPFLHSLADEGMDACLLKMPFHLAVLNPDAAEDVLEKYTYSNWYVGGHSLGGAMASSFAADHGEEIQGVILCAAYPVKQLDPHLLEIVLYGTEDRVLNMEKVVEGREYAPERYTEMEIEGGNHAWFVNYGEQKGDGTAVITRKEQQEEAIRIILKETGLTK